MNSTLAETFSAARRDFRRIWPRLAATSVIYKAIAFTVLTPFTALLLRFLVSTSGGAAVADEQILFFLLSPGGLAGLLVFAGVSLATVSLQQACFMVIAFGAAHGRLVRAPAAVRYVASRWRDVLSLAARVVARVLLIAAPFLAFGGGIYLWLLTEFDINFYLAQKPREYWLAIGLIAPLLAAMVSLLVYRGVAWLIALPTLMFEQATPREALKLAAERVRGTRRTAAAILVGWGLGAIALSSLVAAVIALGGRVTLPWAVGSPSLVMLLLAALLLLWFVSGQVVTFITASAFALLVTRFYQGRSPAPDSRAAWVDELELLDDAQRARLSRPVVVGALVVGLAIGVGVAALAVAGMEGESDVEITAHRGASMFAPENSLAAMQRAVDDAADWVEIDVQESADGRVVVVHDSDFMKLAGVPTKVWEATYADLQQIDIGSSFDPRFADQRTPLLGDVLALARGRAGVNIELKYYGHDDMLEQRVVDIVESMGMQDEIVVMSLKYEAVQKMRRLRPDWTLGLLTAVAIGDLTRLDADFLAVNAGLATPAFVRNAHRAGKRVLVWTINDPLTAYAMINRGVDGIITDDPAMGLRVKAAYNELNGLERLMVEVAVLIGIVDLDDDEPEEVG